MSDTLSPSRQRSENASPLPPTPTDAPLSRGPRRSRTKTARALLVGIFFMLRVPDVFCFLQTYDPANASPYLRANILIAGIWTTIFIVAIWFRAKWAKYLLIALLSYVAVIDGILISSMALEPKGFLAGPAAPFIAQFLLYLGALAIVARSYSIRKLVDRSRLPSTVSSLV